MRKKKKKDTIIKLIMVLLLVAIICGIMIYIFRLNTDYIENHSFYQYFAGRKIEYQGTMKMTTKEGITDLVCNNINIQLDSTPIYYSDVENKAIFPVNMELVIPNENGQVLKVNRFSNIYLKDSVAYLEYRKKLKELPEAFLYDGANLYFFIKEATLEVDGKSYEITPLSYVIANNKSSVEIYNKQEDKYTIIETEKQATVSTEKYTINISLDSIKYGEKEQLLLRKFDDLKTFEMQ